jgi:cyclic pyranopterin phosphate synthase
MRTAARIGLSALGRCDAAPRRPQHAPVLSGLLSSTADSCAGLLRRYSSHKSDTDEWRLSHVGPDGLPRMVDVGDKRVTRRYATARTTIRLPPAVLTELRRSAEGGGDQLVGPKGPIATTAVIAGVLGAKQTSALIPFCHPLPIEDCQVTVRPVGDDAIEVECQVRVTHKTGVEMEALTGASVAALCVYDMCKALSHDIVIESTRLVEKTGGKRDFSAED